MYIILTYWDHSYYDGCCIDFRATRFQYELLQARIIVEAQQEPIDQSGITELITENYEYEEGGPVDECVPHCDQYFNVRMPRWFYNMNVIIGLIFLVEFVLYFYVATNKSEFLFSLSNGHLTDLMCIIMPPVVFSYETGRFGLFC
jgi:hypothetical protein